MAHRVGEQRATAGELHHGKGRKLTHGSDVDGTGFHVKNPFLSGPRTADASAPGGYPHEPSGLRLESFECCVAV